MTRSLFFLLLGASLFLTASADAAIDQRCFAKTECIQQRMMLSLGTMTETEAKAGFLSEDSYVKSVCGDKIDFGGTQEDVGFCSPVGSTVTKISFGGKNTFENIGTFIQAMYQYGIYIATILTVLVIIIGGLQWAMSGGNSSTIDSAKKRIGNAVMGLILAVLSFTILYTINPYLVNLRLPQTWMIKQIGLGAEHCSALPEGTKVSKYVGDDIDILKVKQEDLDNAAKSATFNVPSEKATCGYYHFVQSSGSNTCQGNFCDPGYACVKKGNEIQSACEKASVAGTIQGEQGVFIDDELSLIALCNNGHTYFAGELEVKNFQGGGGQSYAFPPSAATRGESKCKGEDGLAGFYLVAEINDEEGFTAAGGLVRTGGGGSDDWHAIGVSETDPHLCSVNITNLLRDDAGMRRCELDDGDVECSCDGAANLLVQDRSRIDKIRKNIIPAGKANGYTCNIKLSRSIFPDLDVSTSEEECDE